MREDEPITHLITVSGTLSPRFARGCGCRIADDAAPGTTTLVVRGADDARLGAVLRGLENLGVEVRAVEPAPDGRRATESGGDGT